VADVGRLHAHVEARNARRYPALLSRRLFDQCAADAVGAGFRAVELMATLPGEPLYLALGFVQLERSVTLLPDGVALPVMRLARPLPALPAAESSAPIPA